MRLQRPNFRYLATCATLDEAKKVYRQKAQELHPDRPNGSLLEMQQLNVEWDYIVKAKPELPVVIGRQFTNKSANSSRPKNSSFDVNDMFYGFEAFKKAAAKAEAEEGRARMRRKEEERKRAAERPKTINRTELDYEIAKVVIDGLLAEAMELNKLKGSIYFSFVNFIKNDNYLTNRKQLEYIAIKLGYNSGWAYYKQEELKREGLV